MGNICGPKWFIKNLEVLVKSHELIKENEQILRYDDEDFFRPTTVFCEECPGLGALPGADEKGLLHPTTVPPEEIPPVHVAGAQVMTGMEACGQGPFGAF